MEKIKIVRVIARLNIGGPAIQSVLLTKAFNTDEYESALVTGTVDKGEAQMDFLLDRYDIKPIFIPQLRRKIGVIDDLISFFKIRKIISQHRPHIVHTHTAKAGFVGRLAAFSLGVPVTVHTFHGHTFYGYFGCVKNAIFIAIERMLAGLTGAIIAISPLQRHDIVDKYRIVRGDKCRTIFLGLELDPYLAVHRDPSAKKALGFNDNDIVVGTVGRMTAVKDHKLFLEIARIFYDSYPALKVIFAIVGDGELRKDIIAYRDKLNLTDKVRLFGWQEDLTRFYSACDVFALTSKNEGTPVSMIEAMASGIPVISVNVGGIPDVLGKSGAGYLVERNDTKAFAAKLKDLITDRALRSSIGSKARDAVRSVFNKERLVSDIAALYKELLNDKGVIL